MNAYLRSRCALIVSGLLLSLPFVAGCGQPVREDRAIQWSKEGDAVGFQHGQQGVFLADKDGRKLTKIFQPDPGVIATSTPVWSPSGKRILFTTARSGSGQKPVALPLWRGEQDPAGAIHLQQEVVYTCWLYEQSDDEKPAEPVALFEASADHPGYVASNLAIRWHPSQERILYIQQVAPHQHGVFEYDLASKQSRQIFPHTSAALIFDWTPDGAHLVCVLGDTQGGSKNGIWIGDPSQPNWWQVPQSSELSPGEFGSLLENLRSTRPAWTADGRRFAFPSYRPDPVPQQPGRYFLRHGTLATRTVEVWAEGDQPFRDLRWDPAGLRLGVVRGGEGGSLHILQKGQPLSAAINRGPVRRFAGWSASAEHLAYVVPDEATSQRESPWALLLIADALARDQVYLATGDGTEPGLPVFSGMRVTFPQWSPGDDKLSLWVTFMPSHRSVLSHLLGWGLRPGDPAAVFDPKVGQLAWLPVNAQEKVQVGHYFLLKRDYTQALRWYQEAEQELPPTAAVEVRDLQDYWRALQGPRDFNFFEYHCLTKLGRADEAQVKLEQFRRHFLPRFRQPANGPAQPGAQIIGAKTPEQHLQELLAPGQLVASLLQDLYIAEVFLSMDAPADAEAFFQRTFRPDDTAAARLSQALVLGQILLLEKKHQEYAELTTDTVAPLLTKVLKSLPAGGRSDLLDAGFLVKLVGELALLPLGASEFLSSLPEEQLRGLRPRWETLRAEASDGAHSLLDLVLRGLYQALGQHKERQEAATRIQNRPDYVLPVEEDVAKSIRTIQTQMRSLLQRR